MQKLLTVKRGDSGSVGTAEVDQYLAKGWVVVNMEAFHPSHSVSSAGSGYSNQRKTDYGEILVVIEDLGVADSE